MTNPRHFGQIDLFTSVMRTHVNNVNNFSNSDKKTPDYKKQRVSTLSKCEQTSATAGNPESVVPTLAQQNIGEKARNIVAKKIGMSRGTSSP
jgi:hypothetical protein